MLTRPTADSHDLGVRRLILLLDWLYTSLILPTLSFRLPRFAFRPRPSPTHLIFVFYNLMIVLSPFLPSAWFTSENSHLPSDFDYQKRHLVILVVVQIHLHLNYVPNIPHHRYHYLHPTSSQTSYQHTAQSQSSKTSRTSITDSILSFSVIPLKSPLLNCSYFLAFISMISLRCSSLGPPDSSWNTLFLESLLASRARRLTRPGDGFANGSFTYLVSSATPEEWFTFVRGLLRCPLTAERPSFSNLSTCSAAIALRSRSDPPEMVDGPASGIWLCLNRFKWSLEQHYLSSSLIAVYAKRRSPPCLGEDDPCIHPSRGN
jgi:hypothetical protein